MRLAAGTRGILLSTASAAYLLTQEKIKCHLLPSATRGWHPHVCDPAHIKQRSGGLAKQAVTIDWPNALTMQIGKLGWIVLAHPVHNPAFALVISPNQNFFDTEDAAWKDALRRQQDGQPTWHIDLNRYRPDSEFSGLLHTLPECQH